MSEFFTLSLTGTLKRLLPRALLTALLLQCGSALAGILHVAIDTSRFDATSGYLDLQLSASGNVPLATVVINNLVGFGKNAYVESWGVATVPGGFAFRNDTANDLFHAVKFGKTLSFDLLFSGEADPLTRYVSHFVVSAYDEAYALLGNYNPVTGALVDFSFTPGISAQSQGSVGIVVSDAVVTVVPEPGDALLLAIGLAAMGAVLGSRHGRRPRQLA